LANKLTKKMQALQKAELAVAVKEDLKTVALGTSKINYMDPRITIAWCKRNEVSEGPDTSGAGGSGCPAQQHHE
jgi:DNA topoisomerase-1